MFIYFREEGRERQRNTDWLPPYTPQLRIEPTTYACALTGNQTPDPWVYGTTLQPTEPHQPGWVCMFLWGIRTAKFPERKAVLAHTPVSRMWELLFQHTLEKNNNMHLVSAFFFFNLCQFVWKTHTHDFNLHVFDYQWGWTFPHVCFSIYILFFVLCLFMPFAQFSNKVFCFFFIMSGALKYNGLKTICLFYYTNCKYFYQFLSYILLLRF